MIRIRIRIRINHGLIGRGRGRASRLAGTGFPIANDPIYFHEAWGPAMGKGGLPRAELDAVSARFARDKVHVDVRSAQLKALPSADATTAAAVAASADAASSSAAFVPTMPASEIAPTVAAEVVAPVTAVGLAVPPEGLVVASVSSAGPAEVGVSPAGPVEPAAPSAGPANASVTSVAPASAAAPSSKAAKVAASVRAAASARKPKPAPAAPVVEKTENVYRDPLPRELVMWLHAARYSGPSFTFEAPEPSWAADDFDGDRWLLEPNACAKFQSKLRELAHDDDDDDGGGMQPGASTDSLADDAPADDLAA